MGRPGLGFHYTNGMHAAGSTNTLNSSQHTSQQQNFPDLSTSNLCSSDLINTDESKERVVGDMGIKEIKMVKNNKIYGQIDNISEWFVVDTGADLNLISMTSVEKLVNKVITPCEQKCGTANGSRLNIKGSVELDFEIRGCIFHELFFVVDKLSVSVILGQPFLCRNGVTLDFKESKLIIEGGATLRASDSFVLPPLSESRIFLSLPLGFPDGVTGVIHKKDKGNHKMVVAAVLTTSRDGRVPALCVNPNAFMVRLYKGEILAQFIRQQQGDTLSRPIQEESVHTHNTMVNLVKEGATEWEEHIAIIGKELNIAGSELMLEEREQLLEVINTYADVFHSQHCRLGKFNDICHDITLEKENPIRQRPYRTSLQHRDIIRDKVSEMLKEGLVSQSTSPWASPVILVKKKDGSFRFCVDYRKLNAQTVWDSHPLPNPADLFEAVGRRSPRWFSTLDLSSGYHQIAMGQGSKERTAFITQDGLFQFNVMAFGLNGAPATFTRAMQHVMRGLEWYWLLIYLDDIIVFSSTFSEHLDHLKQVFQRFRDADLRLNAKKCNLAKAKVKYLGHILSGDGIATDPEKTQILKDYPRPRSARDIRKFLGFTGYYRKYVEQYSKIAVPLTNLLKKGVKFRWCGACEETFQRLKEALMSPPILAYPWYDGSTFILQCDASHTAISYILAQMQNGEEKVISYAARTLKPAEKNYTITELEALALVQGVKHYQTYLLHGGKFLIQTDHKPLLSYFKDKSPIGRNARWILYLQQFTFDIVHKPGCRNTNVDTLSRIQTEDVQEDQGVVDDTDGNLELALAGMLQIQEDAIPRGQEEDINTLTHRSARHNQKSKRKWQVKVTDKLTPVVVIPGVDVERLKSLQKTDTFTGAMMAYLESGRLSGEELLDKKIVLLADEYLVREDILFHIWIPNRKNKEEIVLQVAVPGSLVTTVMTGTHDEVLAAHLGFNKTLAKVRGRYHWLSMAKDVDNWVRSCDSCAQSKTNRHKVLAPLIPLQVADLPFERVSTDFLGPLPKTKNGMEHVLAFTDHYSLWPILVAVPDTSAKTVAKAFFEKVICEHGAPRYLLSDRGAAYMSEVVKEVCKLFKITKLNTVAYKPSTNGVQERLNSVILSTLSHYVNELNNDWDEYLPAITFAYRSSVCDNSVGYSPFFLLFGREPLLPLDVMLLPPELKKRTSTEIIQDLIQKLELSRKISREINENNRRQMKLTYDKKAEVVDLQVGDCVYLYMPQLSQKIGCRKLCRAWLGPMLIIEKKGAVDFRLRNLETNRLLPGLIHKDRLKYAYDRISRPSDDVMPADEEQRGAIEGVTEFHLSTGDTAPLAATLEGEVEEIINEEELAEGNGGKLYQVDKILRGRIRRGRPQYLVKWTGFADKDNSWIEERDLNDAAREFLVNNPVKINKK